MPSLHDWKPYGYDVPTTYLDVDIRDDDVIVGTELEIERREGVGERSIYLNGDTINDAGYGLELLEVAVDGTPLSNNEYTVDTHGVTIHDVPNECKLKLRQVLKISPHAVDGLYHSGDVLITQCEDESFRKIAYYPDRPDVLSKWTVRVEADREKYPTLLSNGDAKITEPPEDLQRHSRTFVDPHAKPCYLFALAAGKFASLHAQFETSEKKNVNVAIYSDAKSIRSCTWAMDCLLRAMYWDQFYNGLVYDLDQFSIVAVERFVFGAMENKSLNVFNNLVLLANPDIASDESYERIESVVGHEYFHNYSGNRVTVRDWFQLSLKEGLTVYRDQSFSRRMNGFAVHRIRAAELLRREQFPEAQSGLGHPVQPIEMEVPANYYTRTIYEGGAEIAYMLAAITGEQDWYAALEHYFEKYDGQAVTIDDFIAAVEEVIDTDLTQFKRWYSTTGTPLVEISERRENGTVHLSMTQSMLSTFDTQLVEPLEIPIRVGVVGDRSAEPRHIEYETDSENNEFWSTYEGKYPEALELFDDEEDVDDYEGAFWQNILTLRSHSNVFRIEDVPEDAAISVLQDFSAPVEIRYSIESGAEAELERLRKLAIAENNAFARYDATQQLLIRGILDLDAYRDTILAVVDERLKDFRDSATPNHWLRVGALELTLPHEGRILDLRNGTQLESINDGKAALMREISSRGGSAWREIIDKFTNDEPYEYGSWQVAERELRALAWRYELERTPTDAHGQFAEEMAQLFRTADNLSDRLIHFKLLLRVEGSDELKETIANEFYDRFKDESLVVERWIAAYVGAPTLDAVDKIAKLEELGLFKDATPNRWRAAFHTFSDNWENFHLADGSGYEYYTNRLIQDAPEHGPVVRRGIQPFGYLNRYDEGRKELMRKCLERLQAELPQDNIPALDMVKRALQRPHGS